MDIVHTIFLSAILFIVLTWTLLFNPYGDSAVEKKLMKNRSESQKAVIRYFCHNSDQCVPSFLLKKIISDSEYDRMLRNYLNSNGYFEAQAINKIGLDESEIREIEPVHFEGYVYDTNSLYKKGQDGIDRSSKYQVTWIFFNANQLYLYQNTFNMAEDGKKERTEEYFYRDITNFSTTTETEEVVVGGNKEARIKIDSTKFSIVVPGDKLLCSMEQSEYTENSIKGMRSMLRDKKNA